MGLSIYGDWGNLRGRVYGGLANLSQRDYGDLDNLCQRVYTDLAKFDTVQNHNNSPVPLCNDSVQTSVVQCSKLGFCLCSKCSNSLFQKDFTNNLENISPSDFDFFDALSPSSVLSDLDRDWDPFPLDSTSSFGEFQIDENYTKNSFNDQHYLDIPKDRSCPGFNGYNTKEVKENVLPNNFDGEETRLNLKEYKPYGDFIQTDQQIINELTKNIAEPPTTKIISSSSVSHIGYNIEEALVNPCSQDYLDISKAGSCPGFDGYNTKEVKENVLLNNFDGDYTRLNLKECKPNGDFFQTDELSKIFEEFKTKEIIPSSSLGTCSTGMSSVLHNGYNMDEALANLALANQGLANPCSQDYSRMMNASKTKVQEASSLAIPPNGLYNIFDSGTFDYNIEGLANQSLAYPFSQDYLQMINGSKTKMEEARDLAIPYNDLYNQLATGVSQVTMTSEMKPWHYKNLSQYRSWENQTYLRIPNPRREEQLKRYFAKKHRRKFGKQIRYESRKTTAITKRRMKGRFIKAGAEYDYDPSANNTKKGKTKIIS